MLLLTGNRRCFLLQRLGPAHVWAAAMDFLAQTVKLTFAPGVAPVLGLGLVPPVGRVCSRAICETSARMPMPSKRYSKVYRWGDKCLWFGVASAL